MCDRRQPERLSITWRMSNLPNGVKSKDSPPVIHSKNFHSSVDSAVAAFSSHTSAVINAEGVSKLISKRAHTVPLEPRETSVLSVQREFRDSNKYTVGLTVIQVAMMRTRWLRAKAGRLQLSQAPPYLVQSISHLQDSSGAPVSDEVSVGDRLHKIGQCWVGQV